MAEDLIVASTEFARGRPDQGVPRRHLPDAAADGRLHRDPDGGRRSRGHEPRRFAVVDRSGPLLDDPQGRGRLERRWSRRQADDAAQPRRPAGGAARARASSPGLVAADGPISRRAATRALRPGPTAANLRLRRDSRGASSTPSGGADAGSCTTPTARTTDALPRLAAPRSTGDVRLRTVPGRVGSIRRWPPNGSAGRSRSEALGLARRASRGGRIEPAEKVDKVRTSACRPSLMFVVFLVVMTTTPQLLNSVIEEKMSRISEVMLGSVDPFHLMMGKLIGNVGDGAGAGGDLHRRRAAWWPRTTATPTAVTPAMARLVSLFLPMAVVIYRLDLHRHRGGVQRAQGRPALMMPGDAAVDGAGLHLASGR